MFVYSIFKEYRKFYKGLEADFEELLFERYEWESLHLRYLVYYMTKYDIQDKECFTEYHYRVSFHLYLTSLVKNHLFYTTTNKYSFLPVH